ncbi:acyl carrier protein [Nocardia sp. CDC159]|uniref:Acyl carrier protein n=1 Tax=Nocardia pulmonis TaxID=2951408 RepID=A0A9X2EI13_9NOCA|nr:MULTISPECIES: acyl carrier protein [Nocardia]MCM6779028.1 acyl carrier protein [Nocardia pulmonis]MCM6791918.1 acyl carrier protein [Nocardia sp. CDC159]
MTSDEMTTAGAVTAGEVEKALIAYLETKTKAVVSPGQDLVETGLSSSMLAMELVVFLEGRFDIAIVGFDLKLENFRSVERMVDLVLRLRAADEQGLDG